MPELPEVEITRRELKPFLVGKRILGLDGRKILRLERRGKAILIYLSGGKILAFHQRMSGKLLVVDRKFQDKHIRFRYKLSSGKDLIMHDVRKFGIKWYGARNEVLDDKYFLKLGYDPLEINFRRFKDLLGKHQGMIKPMLLRQNILAGIGNIIADESLWKARINPKKRMENFSEKDFRDLFFAILFILRKSIRLGGSSMRDWLRPDSSKGGYFKRRLVYGRAGEKCGRCGKMIIRTKVGGRGTFICELCQPDLPAEGRGW